MTRSITAPHCAHCDARLWDLGEGRTRRWTDRADGSDIFGSGRECQRNETGHEPRSQNA